MRLSSGFVAPSAVAILSTVLLFGPSSTAMSQTAGPATPLPSITVEAPKQVARPRPTQLPRQAAGASRRASPTARTLTARTPSAAPDSVMGKIAKLERASSSCNGGCETSFKTGNAPWVGCSYSAGIFGTYSPTCTDTLTYKTYAECKDTRQFLGMVEREARWLCSGLLAGGKLAGEKRQVAELKRAGRR
jgi:hypothetical protein